MNVRLSLVTRVLSIRMVQLEFRKI